MSDGGEQVRDERLVGGRYRLIERIGSGGMGTVWRAHDELVDREVAVKQPRLPGDPEDETYRRAAHRLYREARAAARVDHPAAVVIHDVVVEPEEPGGRGVPGGPGGVEGMDGLPWIVMELIRGESLRDVLRRGRVGAAEAARIGLAVLGALRAAHSVGIVHRDVKPANVLLGPHDRVVLTDFGIAHVQGEESLTASGEFVGSLEFVAPERMSGPGAGPASDLWSLGVVLYTAVEGWSPFGRTTLESTLAAVVTADPPEPKQAGPLGPLIVRLLTKDPELRPDAEEVAKGLEAVAAPAPARLGDAVAVAPIPQQRERHPVREHAAQPDSKHLPTPEPPQYSAPEPTPAPHPAAPTPKPRFPRPAALALLAALLLVGATAAALLLGGPDSGRAAEQSARTTPTAPAPTPTPTAPASTPAAWTAHREKDLDAVLSLPSQYRWMQQTGEADDDPLFTVYSDGDAIQVRLTRWNKPARSPVAEAEQTVDIGAGHERTAGQYTPTTFRGHEAVLGDTTYDPHGTKPIRVMKLVIRIDDGPMYELRVDMPKGTPEEKKGTAVFKGARDRLRIGAD